MLCRLTGAEAATVVNNNAAATMLVLAALAAGREVIVSRGELVEIGGGFRVPDVMAQSGAILREVGTTNKTRAADYAAAISDRTALLLRVHPSNFRIEGFTERPGLAELVAVGRKFNIPVAEDLGSGHPRPTLGPGTSTGVDPVETGSDRSGTGVSGAGGRGVGRGGRRPLLLQRRQAARRTAGGHHRRTRGARGPRPLASADARAARRQDDLCGARGDARRIRRRPRRDDRPVQRMLTMHGRRHPAARRPRSQAALSSVDGWRAEIVAGRVGRRRRQRARRRAADLARRDRETRASRAQRLEERLRARRRRSSRASSTTACCSTCARSSSDRIRSSLVF